MQDMDMLRAKIMKFKAKYGVADEADEHIITTLHLMNCHQLDLHAAQDRTSKGASDHGIDGWHFDHARGDLYVYQSKFSSAKNLAVKGFDGLQQAVSWLSTALVDNQVPPTQPNGSIYNLTLALSRNRDALKTIHFRLLSPFNENEIEDRSEYDEFKDFVIKSAVNTYLNERQGGTKVNILEYCLDGPLPPGLTVYPTEVTHGETIELRKNSHLDLMFVKLYSLVELFRTRGNNLFEKNVRLYLGTKESKTRIEHPMECTLTEICSGRLSPSIFPYYHVGVTITTRSYKPNDGNMISLEAPSIINGCQTINISDRFLRELEKTKKVAEIVRFKEINVIAKIVTGATDAEVREITNCNNRQNPVENWQLFSNDPIHIEIEDALKGIGVFYERQRGKFNAVMNRLDRQGEYPNTNNTFVPVEGLGQQIAVSRGLMQLAAKPSDIFGSKAQHDGLFGKSIARGVWDIVWSFNAYKAAKRALQNYLNQPVHDNEQTRRIFVKPVVKQMVFYLALMHLYQKKREETVEYVRRLNKKAPPVLVDMIEGFFRSLVAKTKQWYLTESQDLRVEVSSKKLAGFIVKTCSDLGLDSEGPMPFTEKAIDWSEYIKDGENA